MLGKGGSEGVGQYTVEYVWARASKVFSGPVLQTRRHIVALDLETKELKRRAICDFMTTQYTLLPKDQINEHLPCKNCVRRRNQMKRAGRKGYERGYKYRTM